MMKFDKSNDLTEFRENHWNQVWPICKPSTNESGFRDFVVADYLPYTSLFESRIEKWLTYSDDSKTYREYLHASTVAVVLYVVMLFGGQRLMRSRKPFEMKGLLAAWNLLLAVYSLLGTLRLVPHLIYGHIVNPAAYFVCRNAQAHSIEVSVYFWISLFIYSKYFELIDTVFLVLRKRHVSFLHSFHHATVLAYTWHSMAHQTNTGIYFAGMNYFVHAVMYFYYFLAAVRKPPNWGLFVTLLQLAQMFAGIGINVFQYYSSMRYANCDVAWRNIYAAVVMYSAYMALFLHFFIDKYCRASNRSRGSMKGDGASAVNGAAYQNGNSKTHNGTHSANGTGDATSKRKSD